MSYMSYCVTTSESSPLFCCRGMYLVRSSSAITTPAAWMVSCLTRPSRLRAVSIISRTSRSSS